MNAFVSFHGSWNADPAVGYRVDHFSVNLIYKKVIEICTGLALPSDSHTNFATQISNDTNTIESEPFLQYVGPGMAASFFPYFSTIA